MVITFSSLDLQGGTKCQCGSDLNDLSEVIRLTQENLEQKR